MYRIIGADGREYGPVAIDQLRQWVAEGRAKAQTRVMITGTDVWTTLAELPEFQGAFRPPQTRPKASVLDWLIRGFLALFAFEAARVVVQEARTKTYQCSNCGTVIKAHNQPTLYGCPSGPYHRWTKLA